jgi:hypothetical protein
LGFLLNTSALEGTCQGEWSKTRITRVMRTIAMLCLCVWSCASPKTTAVDARTGSTPIAREHEGKGVSLTGTGAYGESHDPSGWSGPSHPTAIGGGPFPKPTASASAPAPPMPPSKELDVAPPSKDLQF